MKKLFLMLAALLAIALPKTAQAVDVEGMYVGGLGGINWLTNGRRHRSQDGLHSFRDRYIAGWLAGGNIGYRMCSGIRAEVEAVFRYNKHKHAHRPVRTWSLMANGYYEINLDACRCWGVSPFIGAGLGNDWTRRKPCRFFDDTSSRRRRNHRNGFAWQVMTGILWDIDDCMEVVIEYRFHENTRLKRLYNHAVDFGVHWFF